MADKVIEGEVVVANGTTDLVLAQEINRGVPVLAKDHPVAGKLVTALLRATPKKYRQKRDGPAGKSLTYVPWAYVARVATQVWADMWSTEILSLQELDLPPLTRGGKTTKRTEMMVHLRVITPRGTQEAYASHVYYPSNQNEMKSDAVAAATNKALRRALARWGIGLDLYFNAGADDDVLAAVTDAREKEEWQKALEETGLTEPAGVNVLSYHIAEDPTALTLIDVLESLGGYAEMARTLTDVAANINAEMEAEAAKKASRKRKK